MALKTDLTMTPLGRHGKEGVKLKSLLFNTCRPVSNNRGREGKMGIVRKEVPLKCTIFCLG